MRPESLIGITLDLIRELAIPGAYPADARVGRFFRERRFLGSRDRRFVGDVAYTWLRHHLRARALWRPWAAARGLALPDEDALRKLETRLALPPDEEEEGGVSPAAPRSVEDESVLRSVHRMDLAALAREERTPWEPDRFLEALRSSGPARRRKSTGPAGARAGAEAEAGAGAGAEAGAGAGAEAEAEAGARAEARAEAGAEDATPVEPLWQAACAALETEELPAAPAPPDDPVEALAVECSLPTWLAKSLLAEQGEDAARRLGSALLRPASLDLRVNLRRKDRPSVERRLAKETGLDVQATPFSPAGLRLPGRRNLTSTLPSRRAWIEVQDEGSQLAVLACEPAPGMTVIDACAGGGGKSLALADVLFRDIDAPDEEARRIPRSGRIYACDIDRARLSELARRARDTGLDTWLRLVPIYPAGPLPEILPPADLVLVDAPCSGLGTLRRNPHLKRRYAADDVERFAAVQREILGRFAPLVKPGGRLAYVACSFLGAEGDEVATAFEAEHPGFEPQPAEWAARRLPGGCVDGHRVRLDPVRTGTDAFFIALWRRREE